MDSRGSISETPPTVKKRLRLLIHPQFQLTLVGVNFLIFLFSTGLYLLQAHRSLQSIQKLGLEVQLPPDHVFFQFLELQSRSMVSYLLISALIALVVSTLFTLYFSHRMAGPIVRFREELKKIATTGQYTPFRFRKNDYFQELPEELENAFRNVNKHDG